MADSAKKGLEFSRVKVIYVSNSSNILHKKLLNLIIESTLIKTAFIKLLKRKIKITWIL